MAPQYQVEAILGAKVARGPKRGEDDDLRARCTYLIKWAGYSQDENTWEPFSSLRQCSSILEDFWKAIDPDGNINPAPSVLLTPPSEWIDEQRAIFKANWRRVGRDIHGNPTFEPRNKNDPVKVNKYTSSEDKSQSNDLFITTSVGEIPEHEARSKKRKRARIPQSASSDEEHSTLRGNFIESKRKRTIFSANSSSLTPRKRLVDDFDESEDASVRTTAKRPRLTIHLPPSRMATPEGKEARSVRKAKVPRRRPSPEAQPVSQTTASPITDMSKLFGGKKKLPSFKRLPAASPTNSPPQTLHISPAAEPGPSEHMSRNIEGSTATLVAPDTPTPVEKPKRSWRRSPRIKLIPLPNERPPFRPPTPARPETPNVDRDRAGDDPSQTSRNADAPGPGLDADAPAPDLDANAPAPDPDADMVRNVGEPFEPHGPSDGLGWSSMSNWAEAADGAQDPIVADSMHDEFTALPSFTSPVLDFEASLLENDRFVVPPDDPVPDHHHGIDDSWSLLYSAPVAPPRDDVSLPDTSATALNPVTAAVSVVSVPAHGDAHCADVCVPTTEKAPENISRRKWLLVARIDSEEEEIAEVELSSCFSPSIEIFEAFPDEDHLLLSSFHDIEDVAVVLRACQTCVGLARLQASPTPTIESSSNLSVLCNYMDSEDLVVFMPLTKPDGDIYGHLLLFVSTSQAMCSLLHVPETSRADGVHLMVTIALWRLPLASLHSHFPSIYRFNENQRLYISGCIPPAIDVLSRCHEPFSSFRSLKRSKNRHYFRGVMFFDVPKPLAKYAHNEDLSWTAWYSARTRKKRDGSSFMEADMFKYLFRSTGVKDDKDSGIHLENSSHHSHGKPRVVFLHIDTINNLSDHPLVKYVFHPSVSLYTFGTSETVSTSNWGFHPVYPLGGIVTFTPNALLDDLPSILDQLEYIFGVLHAYWSVYILPSVLGCIISTVYGDYDPVSCYDKDPESFLFADILEAIEDGKLAVMRAPPSLREGESERRRWIEEQLDTCPRGPREHLEFVLNAFYTTYGNAAPGDLPQQVLQDIATDMMSMQRQPAVMGTYRKFVILTSDEENVPQDLGQTTLSWLPCNRFKSMLD